MTKEDKVIIENCQGDICVRISMTKEEAIECLNFQNEKFFGGQSEALKMAISELKDNNGEWILDETDNSVTCNKCGCMIYPNDISNGDAHFCPNCGRKMNGR